MFGFDVFGSVSDAFFGTDTCGVGELTPCYQDGSFGYEASGSSFDSSSDFGNSFGCGVDIGSLFDGGGFGGVSGMADLAAPMNFDASTMGYQGWIDTAGPWSDPCPSINSIAMGTDWDCGASNDPFC